MIGVTARQARYKFHLPGKDGAEFLCNRNMNAAKEVSSSIHKASSGIVEFLKIEDKRCFCGDCLKLWAIKACNNYTERYGGDEI